MSDVDGVRFYSRSANEVLAAVVGAAARIGGRALDLDDLSRTVTFSVSSNAVRWGPTVTAQVLPVGDGAYVKVVEQGVRRPRRPWRARATALLLAEVGRDLRTPPMSSLGRGA